MATDLRRRRQDKPTSAQQRNADKAAERKMPFRSNLALDGFLIVMLTVFYALVFWTVVHFHTRMPEPIAASAPSTVFSEERARVHLNKIVSFGYKNVGNHANEVQAPEYILRQLYEIKHAALEDFVLDIDVQRPSGSFHLDFISGFTSVYKNVTNIIARAYHKGVSPTENTLMVSAHYDSALGTPSASDDVVNIATMIELIRVLSKSPPLDRAVVFVLNGAEETVLQASHGFITQHPWASSISAFINLEGAGGSGRELVFQTGPGHSFLARSYAEAAHYPFASIIAQEVFQSGLIPAETDFRIYRDYGGIPGIDIAYIANGYIYHTPLDTAERVNRGSLQRCGENILSTLQSLSKSEYLHQIDRPVTLATQTELPQIEEGNSDSQSKDEAGQAEEESKLVVYYDILGIMMLIYPGHVARLLNLVAVFFVLLAMFKFQRNFVSTFRHALIMLSSVCCALLGPILVSVLLDQVLDKRMTWFAKPWLIIGIYACPSFLCMASFQKWMANRRNKHQLEHAKLPNASNIKDSLAIQQSWEQEKDSFYGGLLLWLMLLIVLTLKNSGSSYLPFYWCVFPILGRGVAHVLGLVGKSSGQASATSKLLKGSAVAPPKTSLQGWIHVVSYMLGLTLPTILTLQIYSVMLEFFVPLMGRAGTHVPVDLIVGILVGIGVAVFGILSIGLIHLDVHWKRTRSGIFFIFITFLLIALTSHPYSNDHPKRVYLQHIHRTFHSKTGEPIKTDSGVWINANDATLLEPLRSLSIPRDIFTHTQDSSDNTVQAFIDQPYIECDGNLICNFPWYLPIHDVIKQSWYIDSAAPPPEALIPTTLNIQQFKAGESLIKETHGSDTDTDNKSIQEAKEKQDRVSEGRRRIVFEATGPDHQAFYINANASNPKLLAWSFAHEYDDADYNLRLSHRFQKKQEGLVDWKSNLAQHDSHPIGHLYKDEDRDAYFVYFASGVSEQGLTNLDTRKAAQATTVGQWLGNLVPKQVKPVRKWQFWIEVEEDGKSLEVIHVGQYLDTNQKNPSLKKLEGSMPEWTATVAWSSDWNQHFV